MERVEVSPGGRGFVLAPSGRPFVPWGFNYDHDRDGRLIEEYWEAEWDAVEQDFREMKDLGANVVRIHLQLGKVLPSPDRPNPRALERLRRLLGLAERVGLYLDLTGLGCYLKEYVPEWYDRLDEEGRWRAQAQFWSVVASACAASPAVFCYDLMNEPVVPGGPRRPGEWLGPPFAERYHFVQFIALDPAGRPRPEVARRWIRRLIAAVRRDDPRRLVTVGLVDWSLDRPGLTSGFVPGEVAGDLDFLSVHIYPKASKVGEALETLRGFAVGKPVVIEETFPLECSPAELREFLERSREHAAGWIGFYWGKTPEECRSSGTIVDAIVLSWLELFRAEAPRITSTPPAPR
ncbi:MAG: cellulase family glycosylhydrolase [Planctomycetes bacterium]|nr:cellulase family glycosylhydrolase [Planctomycetota bacterium]